MDVGLNNRNTLGEIAPEFKDVVFFVEATSTEHHTLWSEWSTQSMSNIEPISDDVMSLFQELIGSRFLLDLHFQLVK
jgi:archaellum component FlaC